jgi:hypothetical protein
VVTPLWMSPRMELTGWSLWIAWLTLGCGGLWPCISWSSSLSSFSSSPPWSLSSSWGGSSSWSSSLSSWARSSSWVGGDACMEDDSWTCAYVGSLDSLGHTSSMDMFFSATHGASSSSSSSRSTCSTWEPLVSSNTMTQETSTNLVDLLKTLYALVFES